MKYNNPCFLCLLVSLFLSCGLQKTAAQSYGLTFSSHEVIPEQRTSLDLTDAGPICFSSKLEFSFELSFIPDYTTYFGYVFRLINEKNQNIDLIYDQHKLNFRLINQEQFTDINFTIDSATLFGGWTKVTFSLDAAKGMTCTVNNRIWQTKNIELKSKCFRILFGASNEHNFVSSDLPPMKLRNIALNTDGSNHYLWALDESSGSVSKDSFHNKPAKVLNAGWIRPRHSNWQLAKSFTLPGTPSCAFNGESEELYIISTDTIYTLSARGLKFSATPFSTTHANLLPGNQSIYNQRTGKLYNFYTDQKAASEYNFETKSWNRNFNSGPTTEFWQVNKFFSGDNSLYILCGYGQLKYKNSILKVDPVTKEWSPVQPGGDFLAPRYLSACGTTSSGDTAYILGGFGSKEGDQLLSPKHFYDLLMFDVKTATLKKLYTLPEPEEQFVFANSLIIAEDNQTYYALIFPNSRFNTHLQLIRGSLKDSAYTLLGQPFPYSFTDVKSFVDLYYCRKSNQLLAVTMYTTKDRGTEVKIFSINFPPNAAGTANAENGISGKRSFGALYIIVPAALLLFIAIYFYVARVKRNKNTGGANNDTPPLNPAGPSTTQPEIAAENHAAMEPQTDLEAEAETALTLNEANETGAAEESQIPISRITLFGSFQVVTSEGQNITKQFTPLLKEMFLLILIQSLRQKKGVSSEKLNEILWNGKDIKDAKNNRSVNLVKLKNILEKLGGSTISRETGAWQFRYDRSLVYIDFSEFLDIIGNGPVPSPRAAKLMELVKVGGFLQETHYDWLDNIKAEVSNEVIELLVQYSEHLDVKAEPERVIAACDAISGFDEMNEHALRLKCKSLIALGRHTLAQTTYTKFAVKYKEIYGEEYRQTYNALLNH